jgi:HEPN domain-containing protein
MVLNKLGKELKSKFIKEYTGKKVPKEYQKDYGKIYNKKEAESVFYAFERKHKGLKLTR